MAINIGLVGTNGAGKSTACDWFITQGFKCVSLSDQVRAAATEQGLPHDRATLIAIGSQLKEEYGPAVLAQRAIDSTSQYDNVVFDSIRHPLEIQLLKTFDCIVIGIDAPLELRYDRVQQRKKETDIVSFDVFKEQDQLERSGVSSGQSIDACMALCDIQLMNDRDYSELWMGLEAFCRSRYPNWIEAK